MKHHHTRRRFLSISAAAIAVSGTGLHASPDVARWRGIALGAKCSLELVGVEASVAAPIFAAVQAELERLEGIFSLYRRNSEISRLNRVGHLEFPSPDLLAVLSTCDHLHAATGGAFDPTVQPLFAIWARAIAEGRTPSTAEVSTARALVGWDGTTFDTGSVELARPGAALTLNGIAQGYITDRIAEVLRKQGLQNVLIDMGEISARGHASGGVPWRAGIADPGGTILKRISLSGRALATSAPKGTTLDKSGRIGHIFDPRSGGQASAASIISVSASRAEVADGLSTALCVLPGDKHGELMQAFPGARVELNL